MRHTAFLILVTWSMCAPPARAYDDECALIIGLLAKTGDNTPQAALSDLLRERGRVRDADFIQLQLDITKAAQLGDAAKNLWPLLVQFRKYTAVLSSVDLAIEITQTAHPFEVAEDEFVRLGPKKPGEAVSFIMGSPVKEFGHLPHEIKHRVYLTRPFEIQRNPVTQLQWALVVGDNPSSNNERGFLRMPNGRLIDPYRPVDSVAWDDAQTFIGALNGLEDQKPLGAKRYHYRLPTEAEWEYAARGGTSSAFWFGNDPELIARHGWSVSQTTQSQPVRTKPPNPFGLYDVSGNVEEWTHDWYSANAEDLKSVNPQGPPTGQQRVVRNGHSMPVEHLRSANRAAGDPSERDRGRGLRLVRTER